MNPPQQPEGPPAKARSHSRPPDPALTTRLDDEPPKPTRQLGEGDLPAQPPAPTEPSTPARGRRTRLAGLGLALFCVGLVALASWWVFASRSPESGSADPIPNDPVSLINSRTPIPARYSPLTAKDTLGALSFAPEWESWSPAVQAAYRAQQEGRYDSAISQYSALTGSPNTKEARDALWGLASAYAASGEDDLAIRTYSLFTYIRDDPRSARAFFQIGELNRAHGQWSEALPAYEAYTNHAGAAKHEVMLIRADLLGSTLDGVEAYKAVIEDKPLDIDLREALSALGGTYNVLEKHDDAIKTYRQLADLQQSKPRPLLDQVGEPPQERVGLEQKQAGDLKAARQTFLNYINSDTTYKYGRYSALDDLIRLDPNTVVSGTIDPLRAANIAYQAGYYNRAVEFLNTLRDTVSDPAIRSKAALLTGKAFSSNGDYATAFNWYTATVQTYPASPEAAEACRRAGDVLTEQADWDNALGAYKQTVAQYPTSPQADIARLNGAVLAYRLDLRDEGLQMLGPLLSSELSPTLKAQATFWAGKIQKGLDQAEWKNSLQQVSKLAPGTYFDFRARSLLAGEPDGGPVMPTYTESQTLPATLGVQYDQEAPERDELFKWAASLPEAHKPATAITSTITPALASDPEVQRAAALLQLGAQREYYPAFRALADRLASEGDAVGLAQIVCYLRYHADTRTSMVVAQMLGDIDKQGDPTKWPALLLKTIYPTPYSQLVSDESQTRNIDPLAMYALMRQESQFVPDAQSGADARGLTQVIPSTGQGIADQLGDANYSEILLYRPYVSIRYGAYYLASNLPQFDRKLIPALAAYNGGPGNAARWMSGSALIDPDLYAERIDLYETGDYIERVYRNYGFYKRIYGR